MSDVPDPVEIERRILDIREEIENSTRIVADAYRIYQAAKLAYDRAFATAYAGHDGPQPEKRQMAVLATVGEREARDVAQATYYYARDRAKALEQGLRALQSVGASVRASFGAAGYGR